MKNPTGTIILELSHDNDPSRPEHFTEQLRFLPQARQDQIRKGIPVAIINLETGKTLAVFNKENIAPSSSQMDLLGMVLLDAARKFYQDPANEKKFQESRFNSASTGNSPST